MFIFFFSFSLLTNFLPGVLRSLQAYPVSGNKLHLVGTLERSFFDIRNSFLIRKLPKNYETGKSTILSNRDFSSLRNIDNNDFKSLKFTSNISRMCIFIFITLIKLF